MQFIALKMVTIHLNEIQILSWKGKTQYFISLIIRLKLSARIQRGALIAKQAQAKKIKAFRPIKQG